jgi:hypothetical protein
MDALDHAGEFLRISERYRQMSDEELLVLVPQSSELTAFAQQALANEVRQRGLKLESEKQSAPPPFQQPAFLEHESPETTDADGYEFLGRDSAYDEDRELVDLCTVWSVRDALKVQTILDDQGIPFFMGPEKATDVNEVSSNFNKGIGVQIMQIGLPYARPAMRRYEPEDDPTPKQTEEELDEVMVRCPRCHSAEVIFEGGTSTPIVTSDDSSQKFKWTCDSCGQQWEDDGVAKEE